MSRQPDLDSKTWIFVICLALAATAGSCAKPPPPMASPELAPAAIAGAGRGIPGDIASAVERVDAVITTAWSAAGTAPSPECDDATFVRRAYLDLTGTIPSPDEARGFALDEATGKRAALVARLVQSRAHARHLTNYWDDVLMGSVKNRRIDRVAFRQWLYGKLATHTPYDRWVAELLTASGANSRGGQPDFAGWELRDEPATPPEGVNGAVNWLMRGAQAPQNLAGATARVFLGVQIQCAECHDHPSDKWTQEDFRHFTASFMRTTGRPLDSERTRGLRRVEVFDEKEPTRKMRRRMEQVGFDDADPRALDGTSLEGDSPRRALAAWLTAKDNPWFARALVNRVWASLLGHGFVEPIDDFRDGQAAKAPEALDVLAADFVTHGYDLGRLVRIVTATQVYQRSPAPITAGKPELWQSFAVRPMSADQLLDSLVVATGIEPALQEVVGERLPRLKLRIRRDFHFTFDVEEEEASTDTFTGTTTQALMLLNGALVNAGTTNLEGSTLARASRAPGDIEPAIEALYVAALSRFPTSEERDHWVRFVAEHPHAESALPGARVEGPVARLVRTKGVGDRRPEDAALEDLFWALLNSTEFSHVH